MTKTNVCKLSYTIFRTFFEQVNLKHCLAVLLCKKVPFLGYIIELQLELADFLAVLAVDEALLPFRDQARSYSVFSRTLR